MLAARSTTWAVEESNLCVVADTIANLGLQLRLNEATRSVTPAPPGVVADKLDVDLEANGMLSFSEIPPSGVIDISSSLQGYFSLISEKGDEDLINCPSNATDEFRFVLRGLSTPDEQRQLLPCAGR